MTKLIGCLAKQTQNTNIKIKYKTTQGQDSQLTRFRLPNVVGSVDTFSSKWIIGSLGTASIVVGGALNATSGNNRTH